MKKIIITLILVLLTCIAGYFLYDRWYLPNHTGAWSLIPDDAVIIIESSDFSKEWKDFNRISIWRDLERTPLLQKISTALSVFDSLMTNYSAFSPVSPKTIETGKRPRVPGGETQNNLVDFFGNKRLTISLHINGKNDLSEEDRPDFETLLFLPIKRSSDKKMVNYLLKQFKAGPRFKLKARNFKGFKITEITSLPAREVAKGWQAGTENRFRLAYIIYGNYFIAANTPFLIEDVIRKITRSLPLTPPKAGRTSHPSSHPGGESDGKVSPFGEDLEGVGREASVRVYVNCKKLPSLLSALLPAYPQSRFARQAGGMINLEPSLSSYLTHLVSGKFAIASVLDLSISENKLLLNGFTTSPPLAPPSGRLGGAGRGAGHFLSVFIDQSPQAFSLKKIIPNNTALLLHYGFDDGIKLERSLADYRGKEYVEETTNLLKEYGFDVSSIFSRLDNEIGLCLLQPMKGIKGKTVNDDVIDKLLFLKVKKINEAIDELIMLANATRLKGTKGKTDYDSYRGINIRLLNIKEFPYKIFGNPFIGFERCFFAPIHDYIVLANSQQAIETLIKDIEEENTWGKNIQQNLFLDESISEANLTLIINIPKINSGSGKSDKAKWMGFDHFALQFANIEPKTSIISEQENTISETRDYKFYTSLVLKYQKGGSHPAFPTELPGEKYPGMNVVVKTNVELDFPAITKPYVVKNHYDNSLEIFVQDSHNQIYLLSKSGKILWKKSLGEPIVSDVFQVDLYKNAKLQYLFATPGKIYAFDRKGNIVKNYPTQLVEKGLSLQVIDYDNSKNYRFLVSDDNGNIYMYNKEGLNLQGWNPNSPPLAPPRGGIDQPLIPTGGSRDGKVPPSGGFRGATLQYAGAYNPLWIVRKGELIEIKADKQPIGIYEKLKPFTKHDIELQKRDMLYIFSDGYADQFGGNSKGEYGHGQKFMKGKFKKLLLSIHKKSMEEQKQILDTTIEEWRGNIEQGDDICIVGVRV
ncbi:MAG: SpoIIE family protein phosphatase [Bacteroidetes bacterium]|nr:SpoIIE family protein phosphatase [Bacteroidota bacterium]